MTAFLDLLDIHVPSSHPLVERAGRKSTTQSEFFHRVQRLLGNVEHRTPDSDPFNVLPNEDPKIPARSRLRFPDQSSNPDWISSRLSPTAVNFSPGFGVNSRAERRIARSVSLCSSSGCLAPFFR